MRDNCTLELLKYAWAQCTAEATSEDETQVVEDGPQQ
jgi:hypothetical protein